MTENVSNEPVMAARRAYSARRRLRSLAVWLSAFLLASATALTAYLRRPRIERWLSVPVRDDGGFDLERRTFEDASIPGAVAAAVDFPRDDRMMTAEDGASRLEVETFTGSARDVPFRLAFEIRRDPLELELSLEESASLVKSRMEEERGAVFALDMPCNSGMRFMEEEYPHSCGGRLLWRGTRFWMGEFTEEAKGVKWRGFLIVMRNGDSRYTLERSIPESEWPRGKHLLREDPNIAFSPIFLERRWESPGTDAMDESLDVERLAALAEEGLSLANPFPSLWPLLRRRLDALMAVSWEGAARERERALRTLARFRAKEDTLYSTLTARYDVARMSNDRQTMHDSFSALMCVFGRCPWDRRSIKVNDPGVFP